MQAEAAGEFKSVQKMCKYSLPLSRDRLNYHLILFHSHPFAHFYNLHHSGMPLIVLLFANITILICWTLIDPSVYTRFEIDGAPWSSYARCVGSSYASNLVLSLLGVLNAVVLFLALYQAWKARNISDEFSETKIVGSAVSLTPVGSFPVPASLKN